MVQLDRAPILSTHNLGRFSDIYRKMGKEQSKEAVTTVRPPQGAWNPSKEAWWTNVSSSENITSVGDSLTSCWTLLESAWSVRMH